MDSEHLLLLDHRSELSLSEVNTELLRGGTAKSLMVNKEKIKTPSRRLEVETILSVSVPISIPYYNLSNYKGLFDTVDLLQYKEQLELNHETSEATPKSNPQYANTSHLQHSGTFEAVSLEQVPPKFSNFIADQNSPRGSGVKHRRQISDLMGSQVTIFLARPDGSVGRSQTRPRRVKTYPESSSVHLLSRQSAIRSKEGSFLYRLRLRMRKYAIKLKNRILRFLTPTRKATSKVRMRMPHRGPRFKTLQRKQWHHKQAPNTNVISTPVSNPNLGQVYPSQQALAAQHSMFNERAGKINHLLQFISEQRLLSSGPSQVAFLVDSRAPVPPPHTTKHGLDDFKKQRELEQRARVRELWRTYLMSVVVQRIQLRQEISLFQDFIANQNASNAYRNLISDILLSYHASIVRVGSSKHTGTASESLETIPDEMLDESDSSGDDANVERFQQVLNRRSMLGEMLDYDSDSHLSSSMHLASTNRELLRKYGTVKGLPATQTSSRYSSSPVKTSDNAPTRNSLCYFSGNVLRLQSTEQKNAQKHLEYMEWIREIRRAASLASMKGSIVESTLKDNLGGLGGLAASVLQRVLGHMLGHFLDNFGKHFLGYKVSQDTAPADDNFEKQPADSKMETEEVMGEHVKDTLGVVAESVGDIGCLDAKVDCAKDAPVVDNVLDMGVECVRDADVHNLDAASAKDAMNVDVESVKDALNVDAANVKGATNLDAESLKGSTNFDIECADNGLNMDVDSVEGVPNVDAESARDADALDVDIENVKDVLNIGAECIRDALIVEALVRDNTSSMDIDSVKDSLDEDIENFTDALDVDMKNIRVALKVDNRVPVENVSSLSKHVRNVLETHPTFDDVKDAQIVRDVLKGAISGHILNVDVDDREPETQIGVPVHVGNAVDTVLQHIDESTHTDLLPRQFSNSPFKNFAPRISLNQFQEHSESLLDLEFQDESEILLVPPLRHVLGKSLGPISPHVYLRLQYSQSEVLPRSQGISMDLANSI